MTDGNFSRRKLLARGIQLPLGGFMLAAVSAQTARAAQKACADPAQMDGGQKSIRESLNYTETSKDAMKKCGTCGFFEPKADGCGNCMIFTGPANANGVCDSWSKKEG